MHIINFTMETPLKGMITSLKKVWTKCNDIVLNIDTLPDIPLESLIKSGRPSLKGDYSDKAKYDDNVWYESPDYWYLYKIFRILRQRAVNNSVFYDLGSGKGRILCVISLLSFKKVVGVELFEGLCQVAKKNVENMRGKKAPVEIICKDVVTADLSDGTVYFMFNPFGKDTMSEVLENIKTSLIENPREITIVYYNAVLEGLLQSCGWLEEIDFFKTATGRKVSFWRNMKKEKDNAEV